MLITTGLHVPEIPLGDVAAKVGVVSRAHKVRVVAKSGVVFATTDRLIASVIFSPQLFVASNVSTIVVPPASGGML
ncbi:hypothetical protein BSF42_44050 [Flavobacterium sp. ACN6]|nr:hypothetical protein BSF42_44050 [Flavobacterium sp. ACN6]